ncbi:protein DpdD [Micromonospora chersina]|uniref:protein DpdD n=1 Tax=Micromonospora chersina TaxID=47854 RepID=UPI0033F4CD6C
MSGEVAATLLQRWPSFRDAFFGPPNNLRIGSGIPALDRLLATADDLIAQDPAKPVVLPALIDGTTHYFGLAFTAEESRTLRELLQSHVGKTWTDFDGQSVHGRTSGDPLEKAAVGFAGDSRYVYRFRVADRARNEVRESVQALLASIRSAPRRQTRLTLPIGRLIDDLADACAAGAEQAANMAYAVLASDHRLSRANRLFLQVQVLAAFERWNDLDQHPELDTLLRLPRPSLASDALARLAMSKLADPSDPVAFAPIATRFNALIDSVSAIRSAAGARYYTLWALAAGETPEMLRQRLTEAGWAADPTIVAVLSAVSTAGGTPATPVDPNSVNHVRQSVRESLEAGRFDAAIDLLTMLPTDLVDLPAVVEAVSHTFTLKAIALLERHRARHGDEAIRQALYLPQHNDRQIEPATLPHKLMDLFSGSTSAQQISHLVTSIERTGVAELRAPGGTDAACQVLREVMSDEGPGRLSPGIDTCIDLVRDLKASDAPFDDVRSLSYQVLELWAYHDTSGDRHRLARIAQLVGDLVDLGLGVQTYDEVVELIRAGWDPFLTDADLPLGLDLLEHLLAHRVDVTDGLDRLAIPILSRIGAHNAGRVPPAALAVAVDLAPSFGLTIAVPPPPEAVGEQSRTSRPGTRIGLYSLQEQALDRAARILRERHPGLEVVVCADHVATDQLRAAARNVDLFVVMDRAAAHAATNALKAERGTAPVRYAAGKGSTSMIEAAEVWLREQAMPASDIRPPTQRTRTTVAADQQ